MIEDKKLRQQEVTGLTQAYKPRKFRIKNLNKIRFWILGLYTFPNFIVLLSNKNICICGINRLNLKENHLVFHCWMVLLLHLIKQPMAKQGDFWFFIILISPNSFCTYLMMSCNSSVVQCMTEWGSYGRLTWGWKIIP